MASLDDFAGPPAHRGLLDAETASNMLRYRAIALAQYTSDLVRTNPSAPAAFVDAMEVVELYAKSVVKWAERANRESSDNSEKGVLTIAGKLQEFASRERLVDHVFARAGQIDVPIALREIVRRELQVVERLEIISSVPGTLELEQIEENALNAQSETAYQDWRQKVQPAPRHRSTRPISAVLAVGPPNRFDFRTHDLEHELFGDQISLWRDNEGDPLLRDRHPRRHVVVLVPHLEGTRSLWQPIVVGHEIGHVRLEAVRNQVYVNKLLKALRGRVRPDRVSITRLAGFDVLFDHRILSRWLIELLCDLNSVRMYGPAGLAAVAEMLYVVAGEDGRVGTSHHPPLALRVLVMLEYLGAAVSDPNVWEAVIEPIVKPFRELTGSMNVQPATEDELVGLIARMVEDISADATETSTGEPSEATKDATVQVLLLMLPALIEHAQGSAILGKSYDVSERLAHIAHVAERLSAGLPAEPLANFATNRAEEDQLLHADLVNGAWLAYLSLDPPTGSWVAGLALRLD